jgi:thiamine monophosphate synthase
MLGSIFETRSHPGRAGIGTAALHDVAAGAPPVIAIGGVTAARVPALRAAGAWGVASISSLWDAEDPGAATLLLLAPWREAA